MDISRLIFMVVLLLLLCDRIVLHFTCVSICAADLKDLEEGYLSNLIQHRFLLSLEIIFRDLLFFLNLYKLMEA